MSEKCNTITGVLQRKGTDQLLRNKPELDPTSVQLMDFGVEEWMKFAYNFAKHVNYFSEENSKVSDGDWQSFFKDNDDLEELLENLDESNNLTPHLTLFICFLRLLDFSKDRFNKITKRHLDFFYSEVLKIDRIPAQSDSAYVVFELAKSFDQQKLEKGLGLDGGKDANGQQRIYELTEELAANKIEVAQLKNLYYHPNDGDDPGGDYYMRSSSVANSLDGQGEELPEEDPSWLPFGYFQDETDPNKVLENPSLQKATVGFAVAAEVLNLSEGERHIQFTIDFEQSFADPDSPEAPTYEELMQSIQVFYTAEKKWVGPIRLVEAASDDLIYKTNVADNQAKLYVKLDYKDYATAAYNQEIHLENYDCDAPVFRFIIDVNSEAGAKVYKAFSKTISGLEVNVLVEGMRQLVLDSDIGKLNPTKPMYPFSTTPVVGSNLVIDHNEIFSKNWSSVEAQIRWQNTPSVGFKKWYEAYQNKLIGNISGHVYSNSQTPEFAEEIVKVDGQQEGEEQERMISVRTLNSAGNDPIVSGDTYFEATKYVKSNNQWKLAENNTGQTKVALFQDATTDGVEDGIDYECVFSVVNPASSGDSAGPIRLSLNTSFLHDMYPQLYAIALSSEDKNLLIPNKPYTPFCQEIIVSYAASESISLGGSSEEEFEGRKITLFHELPFGQTIEHDYLRSLHNAQTKKCSLAPRIKRGGELYIGLENVVNLQTVSLYVQLLEGSENPLAESFDAEGVTWEVLCSDFWQKLNSTAIKMNEIDNFLDSGLVRLEIPKNATADNRQLDKGLVWIKAVMPKSYDAVCRVLDIKAQGAMATFVDNDNELSHLENGLPAETIAKLEERLSSVKSVVQPYNSFGGKPTENDALYYKRVSERLRHKNRAIMLWDYESIVLQEFPDIYRVKCLNHTNAKSYLAAGCVTLVVVPDTVNKNLFNILQPRVSTAYLNKIKKYVSKLTSLHVNLDVINPEYQEVKIIIEVKFYSQFDRTLYELELNKDLKKFLSPWAYDETKSVEFGVTLHRSVLIDFVERLHYVDYISSIVMEVGEVGKLGEPTKNATPANPKSILVSAEQHTVKSLPEKAETDSTIEVEC
ncbi:MAG: baseplate J/gp47 family protein [Flavobacteriales bacterium]|nr:baseplate J/gp47 family protein [Flavobacteriales bacterium]